MMRRIINVEILSLAIIIALCFAMLLVVIKIVRSLSPRDTDCMQLLIDNKEQQDVLQKQIDDMKVRIANTDKTIVEHWKDLQSELTRMKEASTTNGQPE